MGPGSRLDAYELVRLLGAGGMGEVWLATDLQLGRKVAIKLLPAALTSDPARVARFEHEARAASSLNHPNVCTIHALGQTADGQRFIAMELVDGQSLRERLAAGPLTRSELLAIAVQIAAALTASHAAGVVHRDLKPENVMLRPDGLVKVVDFGLAKLTDAGAGSTSTTQLLAHTVAGTIVGTVMYMSPEQARGLPVDARTDVWSLGVMLFEMLEGRPPFAGETSTDILAAIIGREPALSESGSGTSQELRRIIGKALRKDREQRYQVMKDLELDLQAVRDEREPHATADIPRTDNARRRTPLWMALAVTLVIAGAFAWWRLANRASPTSPPGAIRRAAIDRPLTRLTFDPGLQTDPAFSPDGRSIAYASDRSGNFDVWVQPVEGGQARQVTTSSAQETQPAWSPDGKAIVYRSEGTNAGLFTVPAEGGPERRLTSFGEHPQWINDREILFVDGGYGQERSRLFVVSTDGVDSPHPLLEEVLRGDHWAWIAAHPTGRISMLGWDKTGATKFVTASRDGKQVVTSEIPKDLPLGGDLRRFTWSSSGDALYLETSEQGVAAIRKVHVDRESLRWREAERLMQGTDDAVAATLAPDGSRLAYSSQRTATRLWTFPLEGDPLRLGKGTPMSPSEGRAANITLSPDGRYAAYVMNRPGAKHFELTLTDIAAGTSTLLALDAWSPAWSRDSKQLAYIVSRIDDQGTAFAMVTRPLGGPERVLKRWSDESLFIPSSWTNDGAVLGSFVKPFYGRSVLAIWASPADTPTRVLVSSENASIWQGSSSPNGRWLSVTVSPEDGRSVFVAIVPATGAPSDKWITPFGPETVMDKPRWSADGRMLFVLAKNGHPFLNLWSMRIDPDRGTPIGALAQVSQFDSPGLGISPLAGENEIGLSGHLVALPITTANGGIWMMENVDR